LVRLPAHLAESLVNPAGGTVAPADFIEIVPGEEIVEVAERPAGLPFERAPPEGAAVGLDLGSRVVMTALGTYRERPAERVETEHRIGTRHERHGGDRRLRHQGPVDGVAEGLI